MDGQARQRGDPVEADTIPWGGADGEDMPGIRAATTASDKSDPNYGGCNKEGSIPPSFNSSSQHPHSPYRESKLTWKFARGS
jgi:hypothetical protein